MKPKLVAEFSVKTEFAKQTNAGSMIYYGDTDSSCS